jgi:hypothetical protein
MSKRIKYIQIVGDALIPLIGYYFWDWSLYFILLFYMADLLVGEVFVWVRAEKIRRHTSVNKRIANTGLIFISLGALFALVLLINAGIRFLHPSINHWEEFLAFWNYREFGVPQGYILLPLLILMGFQQYQLEFLLPGKFRNISLDQLWKAHAISRTLRLAIVATSCGTLFFIPLSDQLVLWLIVSGAALYSLFVGQPPR